jgi:hypothetical protein
LLVRNLFTKHRFEQAPLDAYHYSYPPVQLLLTTPLALMAHVPALLAWLAAVGTLSIAHCVRRCWAKARCCSCWPRGFHQRGLLG